jgi:cytochrome oxidase Cu insertion factor (SCO1/SenC/PrrC family)
VKHVFGATLAGAILGVGALLVVAAIADDGGQHRGVAGASPTPLVAEATWAARTRRAPDFSLQDQEGHKFSLSSLRGRVVLLAFLDSRCTNICQVEGPALGEVQAAFPATTRPVILAVSVNPGDTAASTREAAGNWGWHGGGWHWLMGNPEQLAKVWQAYGVDVEMSASGLLHTGVLYVIDGAGDQRAGYASPIDGKSVTRVVGSLVGASR